MIRWLIEKLQSTAQVFQNLGGPTNRFFQDLTWAFMLPVDIAEDLAEKKEEAATQQRIDREGGNKPKP